MGVPMGTANDQRTGCDGVCNERTFQKCGCLGTGGVLENEEFNYKEEICVPMGQVNPEAQKYLKQNDRNYMNACGGRNIAVIRYYVREGVEVNTLDQERTSVMHIACKSASFPLIEELIYLGAQLNYADAGGWTPLHIASSQGRGQVCYMLLKHGANPYENKGGKSPYDLAPNDITKCAFKTYLSQQRKIVPKTVPQKVRNFMGKNIEIDLRVEQEEVSETEKIVKIVEQKSEDRKKKKRRKLPKKHNYYKISKELLKLEMIGSRSPQKEENNSQEMILSSVSKMKGRAGKRQLACGSTLTIISKTHAVQPVQNIDSTLNQFSLYNSINSSCSEYSSADETWEENTENTDEDLKSSSRKCSFSRRAGLETSGSWIKLDDGFSLENTPATKTNPKYLLDTFNYQQTDLSTSTTQEDKLLDQSHRLDPLQINIQSDPHTHTHAPQRSTNANNSHNPILRQKRLSQGIEIRIIDTVDYSFKEARNPTKIPAPRIARGKSKGRMKNRGLRYLHGSSPSADRAEIEEITKEDMEENCRKRIKVHPLLLSKMIPEKKEKTKEKDNLKSPQMDRFGSFGSPKGTETDGRPAFSKQKVVNGGLPIILEGGYTNRNTKLIDIEPENEELIGNRHAATLNMGVKLLNTNYKMGISFLITTGFLNNSISDLAEFLFSAKGLYKVGIGDIILDFNFPEQKQLLDLYMSNFKLQGMSLMEALRLVFSKFSIPMDIPALDNITKSFAKYYFIQNPMTGILNEEAMHHITFSTLLLDYQKFVFNKPMTKFEYLSINYGLNDGDIFNRKFIFNLYHKVSKLPIIKFDKLQSENTLIERLKARIFADKAPAILLKSGDRRCSGEIFYEKGMFYVFKTKKDENWPCAFFSIDENFSYQVNVRRNIITINKKEKAFPYAKFTLPEGDKINFKYIKEFSFGLPKPTDFQRLARDLQLKLPYQSHQAIFHINIEYT